MRDQKKKSNQQPVHRPRAEPESTVLEPKSTASNSRSINLARIPTHSQAVTSEAIASEDSTEERQARSIAKRVSLLPDASSNASPEGREDRENSNRGNAIEASTPTQVNRASVPSTQHGIQGQSGGSKLAEDIQTFFEARLQRNLSHVRVHTDSSAAESARALNARAFTSGSHIFFGSGAYSPTTDAGQRLIAHELSHTFHTSGRIYRDKEPSGEETPVDKNDYIPYEIHIDREMSRDEFRDFALQVLPLSASAGIKWVGEGALSYSPASNPHKILVHPDLVVMHRAELNKTKVREEKGLAEKRAEDFLADSSPEKRELIKEINRRFFHEIKDKTRSRIKHHETGKKRLWNLIRDEVLFQRDYIRNLPPKVKRIIETNIGGRELKPEEFDRLFWIIAKIKSMPAGRIADYASKVTKSTTNLADFELSLDIYIANMAERDVQRREAEEATTKLVGLEAVYSKYRNYQRALRGGGGAMGGGVSQMLLADRLRKELEGDLKRHGFSGLGEFGSYLLKFEKGFEQESLSITLDLLQKYEGVMYREQRRYQNPSEIAALHNDLAILGASSQDLGKKYPILRDDHLQEDKKLDRSRIANADKRTLRFIVRNYIRLRMKDLKQARIQLNGEPRQIYNMSALLPTFFAMQGIDTNSVHGRIIQDKIESDAIAKLLKGIAYAVAAVALAVVSPRNRDAGDCSNGSGNRRSWLRCLHGLRGAAGIHKAETVRRRRLRSRTLNDLVGSLSRRSCA